MDTISEMLTNIKNAQARGHEELTIAYSRIRVEIAKVLKREGYLGEFQILEDEGKKDIKIFLVYDEADAPAIRSIKRVSKPGRRVYKGFKNIHRVLNGMGLSLISTSQGILTDKEARKKKLGGEIICELY
jgi:small subunit ribosomal protein S8